MNLQDVYQLWDRFEKSTVGELEVELDGARLVMKKMAAANVSEVNVERREALPELPQMPSSFSKPDEILIQAPLVGTFYRAPSPQDAPFVSVGQNVHKDDVVGLIEAMKLMNEIISPCDGVVEAIEVEDGSVVEFDQILIRIKKN
ncbi:MAG: acetyl-CoA carboxylase biotin carboxyl carrier protein [Lachnospiraceae bacterium]